MPKRRTYNFKPLQGSSTSVTPVSASNKSDAYPSVNEKLSDLRKLESKDANARKRQLAESVAQRSVASSLPPEVRGVLGVTESVAPKPKPHVRLRDRMRTPGPAPPRSWLAGSQSSALTFKKNADRSGRGRPRQLFRFARLVGLTEDDVDARPPRLTHLALRTIAESWETLDEDDYPELAVIPLRLRLDLLSYVEFYGSTISFKALRALLDSDEEITRLDLAGLIGYDNLSLSKVASLIHRSKDTVAVSKPAIVDSWDTEISLDAVMQPSLSSHRFSNLTHLCLSHPAPSISWRDLLSFAKHIPQTTHLSLAYWPRPSLTPNLVTATVSSHHSPEVNAGGSHYYSTLDQDLGEPASLLRQLSGHLLRLQWLDLEGCEDWSPALGKFASYSQDTPAFDDWLERTDQSSGGFNTNWRNLKYVRLAQGWVPTVRGIQGLGVREATVIDAVVVDGIIKYLKQQVGTESLSTAAPVSQDVIDVEKKKARIWLQREYAITVASMKINTSRRANGLKAVEADYGWIRRHAVDQRHS